jgi:hypothetical protein
MKAMPIYPVGSSNNLTKSVARLNNSGLIGRIRPSLMQTST